MSLIRPSSIRRCAGFTYIGLLILVAIMGVTLAMIGTFWHTDQQRAREQQLLFIGKQFSNAIYAYYENPPSKRDKPWDKTISETAGRYLQTIATRTRFATCAKYLPTPSPAARNGDWSRAQMAALSAYTACPKPRRLKRRTSAKATKNLPTRNTIPNGNSPMTRAVTPRWPQSLRPSIRLRSTPLRPNIRYRPYNLCRPNPLPTSADNIFARSCAAPMPVLARNSQPISAALPVQPAWHRRISAIHFVSAAIT